MSKSSSQIIPGKAKKVFKGVIFDVYQWEQELFDGSTATFERLKRSDTVEVIPVTAEGKIIILEQEQPGKSPFISVAGGRVDPGEQPDKAAARELQEETGHDTDDLILWKEVQPVGKMDWTIYIYVARNCKKISELHPDPGEKIKVNMVSFDEFIEVALNENFYDKEITTVFLRAKLDLEKMEELRKIILG